MLRITGFSELDILHVEDQVTNVSCHCKQLTIRGLSEKLSTMVELYDRKVPLNTDEHVQGWGIVAVAEQVLKGY